MLSLLLTGCALLGAAQLRVLSMSGIVQLLVVSTSGVGWLRWRWLGEEVLEALGHGQLRCSCVRAWRVTWLIRNTPLLGPYSGVRRDNNGKTHGEK